MSYKYSNMHFRLKGITAVVSVVLLKLQMGEISKTKQYSKVLKQMQTG
jgi:hypothetical protein